MKIYKILIVLIIFGISLLPFIWIPEGFFINGEVPMFMNYETLFGQASYSWTTYFSQGNPASPSDASLLIPEAMIYKILTLVGISNDIVQKLYISITIICLAIAFYLCSKIFTNNKLVFLAGFCFYFFNFYTTSTFTYTAKTHQLILLPMLFFVTYRYFETKRPVYLAINVVVLFLFQSIFTNMPQALATFLIYPLAIVFYLYRFGVKSVRVKEFVLLLVTSISTVAYQILIWYFSLYQNLDDLRQAVTFKSLRSPINRLFQFRGVWWENSERYNPLLQHYNRPTTVLFSFLIIFFLIYLNVRQEEDRGNRNFWLISFLFFLGLSSGTNFAPGIYETMYEKLPLFYIFREPWAKFTAPMIFCLSLVAIIELEILVKTKKSSHCNSIILGFLVLVLTINSPFFTRDFFGESVKDRLRFSKPPDYWWEYKKWTADSSTPRILPLPFTRKQHVALYKWYPDFLGNTSVNMPLVFGMASVYVNGENYKPSEFYEEYINQRDLSFIKTSGLDYVMIQKDLQINEDYNWQYNFLKEYVNSEPEIVLGDKLLLYSVKDEYFLDSFYIPNNVSFYSGNGFVQLTKSEEFKSGDAWMQDLYRKDIGVGEGSIDRITRDNPTKYKIEITTKNSEIPLIFLQQYNKYWKVYCIDGSRFVDGKFFDTWLEEPIVEENAHFPVNSYQNYWKVNIGRVCELGCCQYNGREDNKKINLVVEYWPQKFFYIGAGISITTFVVCVAYIILNTVLEVRRKVKNDS